MTDFRYLPLAADGFALTTLSTSAWAFSIRFSAENDTLPTGAWMMPVLSTRNSTLPALISLTAWATFGRDRAGLRVRHQAARPEHLAEPADRPHHVRRRDDGVEVHPAAEDLLDDLVAADEVGAGLGALPSACRRRRWPAPACSGRDRAAARPCRAPSGRRAWDRRPAASPAPPSRRTWRTSPSAPGESPPRACTAGPGPARPRR